MRKLVDILNGIRDNVARPDADEAYYTILTLDTVVESMGRLFHALAQLTPPSEQSDTLIASGQQLLTSAIMLSPKDFMGDFVPGNAEYDTYQKQAKEAAEKAMVLIKESLAKMKEQSTGLDLGLESTPPALVETLDDDILVKRLKEEDKLN